MSMRHSRPSPHVAQPACERASLVSRLIGTTVSVIGLVLASGLVTLALGQASPAAPKPIPGGFPNPFVPGETIHFFLPAFGIEPSLITDFNGFVGVANAKGTGTGTDNTTGISTPGLPFDSDVRFMTGVYVGRDGKTHQGTFIFV